MVMVTPNPNFLLASCCKVEVVNGAAGLFSAGFTSKFLMLKVAFLHFSKNAIASASVSKRFGNSASICLPPTLNFAVILNAELELKLLISRSRSTINLTATD